MNPLSMVCSLPILLASSLVASAAPLLHYELNTQGAVQSSTGTASLDLTLLNYQQTATDFIRANPDDRSGQKGGYALDLTAATVDAGVPSGQGAKGALQNAAGSISSTHTPYLTSSLSSFTVSAWVFNANANYDSGNRDRRVFSLRNSSTGVIDFRLTRSGLNEPNSLTVTLTSASGGQQFTSGAQVNVPAGNQTWHFIALTYDADTGTGTFYSGPDEGLLTSSTFSFLDGDLQPLSLMTNATSLAIGNAGYNHARRFDGFLSDVRFYGTALSPGEIGSLHAIPESGAASLLLGGGLTALVLKWGGNRRRGH